MYSFESRIRYSELDAKELLALPSLVNYFQDCSTFQSEDLGVGLDYLRPLNYAWVVSAWQIDIDRFPGLCEKVLVGTSPYEIKGFIGLRNFFMKDENGEYLARANSYWTLLDMEKGFPTKADEKMISSYKKDAKLDMEYLPRKIALPSDTQACEKEHFFVQYMHLDGNGHVNNAQYVNMSMPYVEREGKLKRLRVEYKGQAHQGDEIVPVRIEKDGKVYVILNSVGGTPYTVSEFTY